MLETLFILSLNIVGPNSNLRVKIAFVSECIFSWFCCGFLKTEMVNAIIVLFNWKAGKSQKMFQIYKTGPECVVGDIAQLLVYREPF